MRRANVLAIPAVLAAALLAGCATAPERAAGPPGNHEITEGDAGDGGGNGDDRKLRRPPPERMERRSDPFDAGGELSDPERARDDEVDADGGGPTRLDLTDM